MGLRPKNITKTQLEWARIPRDYWDVDFVNFQGPEKPMELTKAYLKNLSDMKDKGIGLMYVGANGPGKTTLAMIAMKYLVRAGWSVHCTSLGELIEVIQRGWKGSDAERILAAESQSVARDSDFLFIDDIGKEHRGQSGFVSTVFDNLIRHRVQFRRPTFLTTNLTKGELESAYGESVMSLIEGRVIPVTVSGDDYRRSVLKKEAKEILKRC